jgi:hypothetical protein
MMKKIASEKNYRILKAAQYKSRKVREWEKGLNRTVLNGINLTLRGFGYCIKGPESGHCQGEGEYSLVKTEPYPPWHKDIR